MCMARVAAENAVSAPAVMLSGKLFVLCGCSRALARACRDVRPAQLRRPIGPGASGCSLPGRVCDRRACGVAVFPSWSHGVLLMAPGAPVGRSDVGAGKGYPSPGVNT